MKSIEFIIAIIAAAFFVFESNKSKSLLSRFNITIGSAGLGFSAAPEVSEHIGGFLVITGMLITAIGFLILEVIVALLSDINFIKKIIEKKMK